MRITKVRIHLALAGQKLRGFARVTLDGTFVVRDIRIIQGPAGLFIAMPSRKLTSPCQKCGCKNELQACFCSQCGQALGMAHLSRDERGRDKLFTDVVHPITPRCRRELETAILEAYQLELNRSQSCVLTAAPQTQNT